MKTKSKKKPLAAGQPDAAPPRSLELTATATFDLEAAGAEGGQRSLPRFRMVAYTGGPMRLAGWRWPVVIDLAGLSIPSQTRPIRFGHDALSGIGHTDSIKVEGGQLLAAGVVSRDTSAAREVVVSSQNGFPWQASVGTTVEQFEFVRENQKTIVNGRQYEGPMYVVRKATLGEISFVDLGADGATSARIAAQQQKEQAMEFDQWLEGQGFSRDHLSEQQSASLRALYDAQQRRESKGEGASDEGAPVQAGVGRDLVTTQEQQLDGNAAIAIETIRAQAAAETDRIDGIRKLCGGRFPRIEAQAIREGWELQRTELEVLRATRPTAPAIHVRDNQVTGQVLEAACFITAGLADIERAYQPQTLELANRRFRGSIGLQELLLEAAWANGYTGRNFRDHREVLRYAFGHTVEAAFSTIDIGGILSNVANKFLLEGFSSVERTWRNICAVRNVSDFKTVTSYRLVGKDQYELVAPGGELKHGTLGEEKYTNKADTYALLLQIDRRDIINDDLGAITTVPRKLGRGSGLKINDVFWATFLDNATFFTVGNKNYLVGADTALSIDGLTKGEVAFMDQVDSDGKPIGIMPAILLVPTSLSASGTQLYKSLELRDTTANTKFPVANPHQGKFRVEVSRYLSNAQYTGNSNKAWYLLADPTDLPVIEVAFLNGQESPTIETAEADFNVLGVQLRGYHDLGVSKQEPRGGVKCKGEA